MHQQSHHATRHSKRKQKNNLVETTTAAPETAIALTTLCPMLYPELLTPGSYSCGPILVIRPASTPFRASITGGSTHRDPFECEAMPSIIGTTTAPTTTDTAMKVQIFGSPLSTNKCPDTGTTAVKSTMPIKMIQSDSTAVTEWLDTRKDGSQLKKTKKLEAYTASKSTISSSCFQYPLNSCTSGIWCFTTC
eukprot:GHUV01056912.1.p2 GENE.GHUV01056912.1~~GHUV01056912.1.p2  ORF type:complete len:192 (-),score=40.20 GHUV01056912.1:34-609(-)